MESAVTAFNEAHGLSGGVATSDMQALAFSAGAIAYGESDEGRRIAFENIPDGTYTGSFPGCGYTASDDPDKYTISANISPAEVTVTILNGKVQIYCAASVVCTGTVYGAEAPLSPTYTQTVSGSLPLRLVGNTLLYAEGDLSAPGESIYIYWENYKFTRWEVYSVDNVYHCTVSIYMSNGVPLMEVAAAGSKTYRSCTIPLARESDIPKSESDDNMSVSPFAGSESTDDIIVLWTNGNAGAVQNNARDYYVMCDLPDCTVVELETYHYLSDGKAPGQIMLFGEDGSEYGPFQAEGRDGQGGVKNACWAAKVNIDLPAGRYAIADEDQSTWSNNVETDGWGMATVYGILKDVDGNMSPWTGTWDTTHNLMTLIQKGDTVTGSYGYSDGKIEGTVSGNTLSGTWMEQGSLDGRFVFTLSPDGKSFTGTYGSGEESTGGAWGEWNGSRQ